MSCILRIAICGALAWIAWWAAPASHPLDRIAPRIPADPDPRGEGR